MLQLNKKKIFYLRGYTLIEVLIATAIFAIIGTVSIEALIQNTRNQKIIVAKQKLIKKIARSISIMESDLSHSLTRFVSDQTKTYPAFMGAANFIEFTNNYNFFHKNSFKNSGMQRVSWLCKDHKLIRRIWFSLDVTEHYSNKYYTEYVMLDNINNCSFTFIEELITQITWPKTKQINPETQKTDEDVNKLLPDAVRFSINLPQLGDGDFLFLLSSF